MTAPLSKELRTKYGRSLPVRTDDTVKIVRGQFKGTTDKVLDVSMKGYFLHVKGASRKNARGQERLYPISPSNVIITELNLEDERRSRKTRK